MNAVILAAGQGTRLGDLTASTPKCLVKIQGTSILKLQIDLWKLAGIDDFSIVIGAKGDCWTQDSYNEIRDICEDVTINFDNEITQNSFSLLLGLNRWSGEDILFVDGDIVLNSETANRIIACQHSSFIVTKQSTDKSEPGNRVESDNDNIIKDIGKSIQPNHVPWTIYGGIGKLDSDFINEMKSILLRDSVKEEDVGYPLKMFSETNTLINLIINDGWINVNTLDDIKNAEEMVKIDLA